MGGAHSEYCRKESDIAKLEQQVETLNGIVMGNEGLAQTVPVLNRNVSELSKTIGILTTGVSGLLKFQENQIGIQQGKGIVRKRNKWILGIFITAMIAMAGIIITLITRL